MSANSVEMVLTDVPYGAVSRSSGGLRNLDKGKADETTFELEPFLSGCHRVARGTVYVFCGTEQVSLARAHLVGLGMTTRLCVWRKTNPSPMNGERLWLSGIEACVFGRKGGAKFNERCKNCVWDFATERGKVHPTQKPLKLFRYLVAASSDPGDVVFDPCMGSGTTALAARLEGRGYLGVEKDPTFHAAAVRRLEVS